MSTDTPKYILALLGILDLIGTALIILSYHGHMSHINIGLEFALLPWQVLHAFSWFVSLLFSTGELNLAFGETVLGIYIGTFFGDVISVIWRFYVITSSLFFVNVIFWTTVVLCFVDLASIIFTWILIVTTRPADTDDNDDDDDDDENIQNPKSVLLEEEKEEGEKLGEIKNQTIERRVLSWLWISELILIFVQLLAYVLGLNRSMIFSKIIILERSHAFLWILQRTIASDAFLIDIPKKGWYKLGFLMTLFMVMNGIAATGLRIYYIMTDLDNPASLIPSFIIFSGWFQFSIGVMLLLTGILQFIILSHFMSN